MKLRYHTHTFSILLFSFIVNLVIGQDYKFDHLTANQGLGDDFVRCLFEDSYGFIWIGTKDGLSRYDGYKIKTYKRSEDDTFSLPSSYIGSIVEDETGNLWIGTSNGIGLYEREYDRFKHICFSGSGISEIVVDSGYAWIGTRYGLCRLDIETFHEKWYFTLQSSIKMPKNHFDVSRMIKGDNGILWIGFNQSTGLVRLNTATDEIKQYFNPDQKSIKIERDRISSLEHYTDSLLFVGYEGNGGSFFNIYTETFTKFYADKAQSETGMKTPWCFLIDSYERIWVGAINGGLFQFDTNLNQIANLLPYRSNTYGLNSPSVSAIMEDKHGNLWFGTHGGGVNILRKRKNIFVHFKRTESFNSLSHNFVSSFYESSPNELWVGTDGGGLNLFNRTTKRFKNFSVVDGLSSNAILSISPIENDKLLLSSWGGGINIFDMKTFDNKIMMHDTNDPNTISYNNVKYACKRGDSIYIVTHGDGLNIYDLTNNKIYNSRTSHSTDYMKMMGTGNKLIYDSDTNMWVATTFGLYKVKNEKIWEFLPDSTDEHSISDLYVTDLYEDSKNRLWVGTLSGLNLFIKPLNKFQRSTHKELQLAIMSIVEDNYGNLWMGSNSGLIKYNPDSDQLYIYNESDGLQGNQFFERAAYKDSEGNLFFGGMNGYNTFHPSDLEKDTSLPYVFFNDFKIFYQSQVPGMENSVLEKQINFTNEVVLDYSQKIITIEFVALHMLTSSKNQYSYILEGFDKNWYYVGNNNNATYTNLAPGQYKFRVRASNADDTWTKESKDLIIRILPPWWMTWWFRFIGFSFIVMIIFLIIWARTRNMKLVNKVLETKVRERTDELEQNKLELMDNNKKLADSLNTKDRFFSIIAHDLKNPMNALIGFSEILMTRWAGIEDSKKHRFISLINESSNHLFALLTNLLEWSRAQTGKIQVKFIEFNIKSIIGENVKLLEGQAGNKLVTIKLVLNEDLYVLADYNMIDTVLRNIISNAIKYTKRDGEIVVGAYIKDEKNIAIYVKDDGVGMSEDIKQSLFRVDMNSSTMGTEMEKGTGLGLIVCNEFIKINNGSIQVESEKGAGSTFTICLPRVEKPKRITD